MLFGFCQRQFSCSTPIVILSNQQVLFLVQSSKEFADFWSCKTSASIVLVEIALVGVIFYVTMSCYSMDGQNTSKYHNALFRIYCLFCNVLPTRDDVTSGLSPTLGWHVTLTKWRLGWTISQQQVRRVKSLPFAELQIEMDVTFSQLQLNSKHYSTPGVILQRKTIKNQMLFTIF